MHGGHPIDLCHAPIDLCLRLRRHQRDRRRRRRRRGWRRLPIDADDLRLPRRDRHDYAATAATTAISITAAVAALAFAAARAALRGRDFCIPVPRLCAAQRVQLPGHHVHAELQRPWNCHLLCVRPPCTPKLEHTPF